MQKINFIPPLFPQIIQRYCKLVILGTSDILCHVHQKQQYQLVGNFVFYLHAENQLDTSLKTLHFKKSCNLIGQQQFRY